MDQATFDHAPVQPGEQKTRKASAKPPGRKGIKPHGPKKARADGIVKATILLSAGTDELLTSLAYTRNTDRSEVVRYFFEKGLRDVNLETEAEKAQKRFLASVKRAAESTGASDRQTGVGNASSNDGKSETPEPTPTVATDIQPATAA